MPWSKTYLYQLKHRNKSIFFVIVTFILLTFISMALKNEMSPFYLWAMYSREIQPRDSFDVYVLEYNNGQVYNAPHTWKDHKRMMFFYTITHYIGTRDNNGIEHDYVKMRAFTNSVHLYSLPLEKIYIGKRELDAYPAWLQRYMQSNINTQIDSIKVYRKWIKYNTDGRVYLSSKNLVFKHPE